MDVLPQPIRDYLEELRQKVESEVLTAAKLVDALFDLPEEQKKLITTVPAEYVKRVKVLTADQWMQSYLLRSREWLLGDHAGMSDAEKGVRDRRSHFVDHLEKCWRSKLSFWKDTKVEEIAAEEREYGPGGRQLGTQDL